ncbi:MAG: chemoreceptor glutamine deamidase CheD [Xanthobacteraceae bacterium]|nr:chemoreceptor glutamine deamidase CheD [Xanthobacteraceae bacterium]
MTGRRFYDSASSSWLVKVYPGEFHVTSKPDETLVTVLGSCVAACIRDPRTGFGGMNHFMLAEDQDGKWGSEVMSTRYGNYAMEKLINELIKAGCPRERMEIKVFGGGNVIESRQAVGTKNAEFVLRYLADEGLKCTAQDLGGDFPRRIQYSPASGKVVRKLLGRTDANPIARDESEYMKNLTTQPTHGRAGEITLFGDK